MVKILREFAYKWLSYLVVLWVITISESALGIFSQSDADLKRAEDLLRSQLLSRTGLLDKILPTMLAPPRHHWIESRDDFAEESTAMLKRVFTRPNGIILCSDCDAWRLYVETGRDLKIHNGPLSLGELGKVKQNPAYEVAKSLTTIRETPSGVEIRIMDLTDGRLLVQIMADSTEKLTDVKRAGFYGIERERRLRGESLNYAFINLGLYPNPVVQLEFLEQWGERNEHLSGVGLSLVGPLVALGGVYHYPVPSVPKFNVAGAIYLPLANALSSLSQNNSSGNPLVLQGMAQYGLGDSYAVFASISTEGNFSLGFTLFNPLFLPFLL
jgi:hypothetical protein